MKDTYEGDPPHTYLERTLCVKRDQYIWEETLKRDLRNRSTKETCERDLSKRPTMYMPRENFEEGLPFASEETGACEKRPRKETY